MACRRGPKTYLRGAPVPTEDDIQMGVVQLLDLYRAQDRLEFWHVPNGGHRSKRTAARLKALGTRAGVWDIHLAFPGARLGVIEMKRPGGKLSDSQKAFESTMTRYGFVLRAVCFSVNDVQNTLKTWKVI